jgi:formate/nitrite transporter FocA (FNT family)/protein-disulfide isomerase
METHSNPDGLHDHGLRDVVERSRSGAPSAGKAVSDLFSTDEIFHRLTAAADEEFSRSTRLLFLSGVAAGLSISLSFVASAPLTAKTSAVVGSLLYPLGFIIIALGRYQLFTENTLTPVTLVLTRIASLPRLLRIWGVVLAANVLGCGLCAYVLAETNVFNAEAAEVALEYGRHFLEMPWATLFWKGVFAGWLVASMVWLNHAVRTATARVAVTFVLMYTVSMAELAHCIVGASEVLYFVFRGQATILQFFWEFLAPAALGNTVGGVLLVAILNYSQTRALRFPDRDCGQLELTWREWLLGREGAQPRLTEDGETVLADDDSGEAEIELNPPVGERDHRQGPSDAPVTVAQYGDYECPTSRKIYRAVKHLLEQNEDDVQFAYRHLPLSRRHPHAEEAAVAAEAADAQDRFWDMHERLFERQSELEADDLRGHADALKLDRDQFERDLRDESRRERVHEDRQFGIRSGVRRTSNLFINGRRYRGDLSGEALQRAVDRALGETARSEGA